MTPIDATPAGAGAGTETPATETVTATVAAADAGDFSAFQDAEKAARAGTPAPKVERPKLVAKDGKPVTGRDGQPAKGPKPGDVAADERLATRVREAVDQSTADLRKQLDDVRAENLRLRPVEKKEPAAEVKAPTAAAEFKRIAALPGAPKAEDFETTTEHAAALGAFVIQTQGEERAAAERDVDAQHGREKASIERVQTFHGRINAYKATEAGKDFAAKLTPEVKELHGWSRLQADNMARVARGEPPLPGTINHAIAEELYDSEAPAQMAVYLSEHPDDLAALRACPNPPALTKLFSRLEAKVLEETAPAVAAVVDDTKTNAADLRARADAAIERSVSKTKPPAPEVGRAGSKVDPIKHALETGDVGVFLELDRQSMAEKRGIGAR